MAMSKQLASAPRCVSMASADARPPWLATTPRRRRLLFGPWVPLRSAVWLNPGRRDWARTWRIVASTCVSGFLIAGPAVSGYEVNTGRVPDELTGRWRNPQGSVHVEIRRCGKGRSCGYVVWASEQAKADAQRGGTRPLIGLELFRNLVREREGQWRGAVFVPDLNSTFSGTARRLGSDRFRATGCLLRGMFCRSQIWTQVDDAALRVTGLNQD